MAESFHAVLRSITISLSDLSSQGRSATSERDLLFHRIDPAGKCQIEIVNKLICS